MSESPWPYGRGAIAREIQSILGVKFQVAKKIVLHAEQPKDTFARVGERSAETGKRREMSSQEAKRIVDAAVTRMKLIDEGEATQAPGAPAPDKSEAAPGNSVAEDAKGGQKR